MTSVAAKTQGENDPLAEAYELCKLHASVNGAFPEALMRHWFDAAWDLCAGMIDFQYPPQQTREVVHQRGDGSIRLRHMPTSEVKFFAGPDLVAVVPPNSPCFEADSARERYGEADGLMFATNLRHGCDRCPDLCCACGDVTAVYAHGDDSCRIPPRFMQAVARLFTYIAENRGDVELNDQILKQSGAFAFLGPDVTYAL